MNSTRRKGLLFGLQFLPLFLLCLWLYSKALPSYQTAVFGVANAVTERMSPPTRIEAVPDAGWWAYRMTPAGDKERVGGWADFVAHLVFLSLALLPALLLATPAPWLDRIRLLGIGLLLLFCVHVVSIIGLVRETQCLVVKPGTFHCLWLLRLVYSSGQVFGAVLWALLTWRYWFPRKAPPETPLAS